ncbi:hypothetical protein RA210_U80144 [Rubrivivax sp. A210]|nr:hypothetical protein RA210_U80144 [Rubrivivax sp. A210]
MYGPIPPAVPAFRAAILRRATAPPLTLLKSGTRPGRCGATAPDFIWIKGDAMTHRPALRPRFALDLTQAPQGARRYSGRRSHIVRPRPR